MTERLILTGGAVVAPDGVYEGSSVVIEGGRIVAVTPRAYSSTNSPDETIIDCGGRFVLPGVVCLHNDAIEKAVNPRPNANLPLPLALATLDRQLAAAGVTTQFNAIMFEDSPDKERAIARAVAMHEALVAFAASGEALVEHHTHFRCDVRLATSLDAVLARVHDAPVQLVSLNDHVPGQGQMRNLALTAAQLATELGPGMTADAWLAEREEFARTTEAQVARSHDALAQLAQASATTLMSHDDDSAEKVDLMYRLGCRVAEFPVTREAARRARELGIQIAMGAPNLVRGGSLSGNISALALAHDGLLDILIADYHAPALLAAAWALARAGVASLPAAVAMIATTPAATVGLTDRGALLPGQRADMLVVRELGGVPVVTQLLVAGELRYAADRRARWEDRDSAPGTTARKQPSPLSADL
jgi:alpha-D-ribose 1-methylphosphonate 5-triphosphate diphosphatase